MLEGGVDSVVLAVPWRLELFVASYLIDKTRVSCKKIFLVECVNVSFEVHSTSFYTPMS